MCIQVDLMCEIVEGDRSSPSGQSDQASSGRPADHISNTIQTRHYVADKVDFLITFQQT